MVEQVMTGMGRLVGDQGWDLSREYGTDGPEKTVVNQVELDAALDGEDTLLLVDNADECVAGEHVGQTVVDRVTHFGAEFSNGGQTARNERFVGILIGGFDGRIISGGIVTGKRVRREHGGDLA